MKTSVLVKGFPYEVTFMVTGSIIAPERITLLEVLNEQTREVVVLNHEREEEIILRVAQNLENEDFLAEEEEDDFCSVDDAGYYGGEILFPYTSGVDEAHSLLEFQDTVKFHNKMKFTDEEDMQYQDVRDPHL